MRLRFIAILASVRKHEDEKSQKKNKNKNLNFSSSYLGNS